MDVTHIFPALADPTRRAILESLARQSRAVGELSDEFPISRPAVSQHLRVLQDAGLVEFERVGTRNVYKVDPAGLTLLREYLDDLWSEALGNLKTLAESTYRKSKRSKR